MNQADAKVFFAKLKEIADFAEAHDIPTVILAPGAFLVLVDDYNHLADMLVEATQLGEAGQVWANAIGKIFNDMAESNPIAFPFSGPN
jgi:hypothetical protein